MHATPQQSPRMERAQCVPLWRVELQVVGQLWWPIWIGHALDSIDATEAAKRSFYGDLYGERTVQAAYPLRVRSVTQVCV